MKFIKFIFYLLGVLTVWCFASCKNSNDWGKVVTKTCDKMDNGFTRKDDAIWFYEIVLQNLEPNTFNVLNDYFFKDKNHVYFYESYRTSEDYFTSKRKRHIQLEKADPASFISLGLGYAKDKNTAKYFSETDVAIFKILNEKYTLDKNGVYYHRKKVKNAKVLSNFMGDADA
jgi:hypothetical protein